jgi:hypothetical protein
VKPRYALALFSFSIVLSASVHAHAESQLYVRPIGNKMSTTVLQPAPQKLHFSTAGGEAVVSMPCRRELRVGGNKMTSLELACPARRSDAIQPLS